MRRITPLLLVLASSLLHAGSLINFVTTQDEGITTKKGATFNAYLKLGVGAKPTTLKVTLGNKDVTSLFSLGPCGTSPCEVSATLTQANGVLAGWNFLAATIQGPNDAVDSASFRFYSSSGLQSTNSSSLPYFVSITETPDGGVIVQTPNQPVTIPACPDQIETAVLDRSLLTIREIHCFDASFVNPYLLTLGPTDLVIISSAADFTDVGVDFTPIGGSNFALDLKNNILHTGYSAVGYGGAGAGLAYEAWQEPGDTTAHYKSINGNLINIGCPSPNVCGTSSTFYTFQPTNAMGFAIIPGAAGVPGNPGMPTIYLGNPTKIPFGSNDPPRNQIFPTNSTTGASLFTSTADSPLQLWQAMFGGIPAAGGMWLLTLNRSDLSVYSSQVFLTNCGSACQSGSDNTWIMALASALSDTNPNRLFLLTSIGVPFNATSDNLLLEAVLPQLGVSGYALQGIIPDQFGTLAQPGFSMVGYYPGLQTSLGKMYSSAGNTQQGETGALRGIFAKQHSAFYEGVNVAPFDTSYLQNPTNDDFLLQSASYAIGSSEPVAWPYSDTAGGRNAYAYISNILVTNNLSGGATDPDTHLPVCAFDVSTCQNIRFFYVGSQANQLYPITTPAAVQYPGDTIAKQNGFGQSDFNNLQSELTLEQQYLTHVLNYQNGVNSVNSSTDLNVALVLEQSAADVTTALEVGLGTPAKTAGASKLTLSADAFNCAAAFASIFTGISSISPVVAPIAGMLWLTSGILEFFHDTQKTTPQPDPYVTQLADLTQQDTDGSVKAAVDFNNDLSSSSTIFFNGVYSDWFRFQAVATLATDPNNAGWYTDLSGNNPQSSNYTKSLMANERTNFYLQVLPQYMSEVDFTGAASAWIQSQFLLDPVGAGNYFGQNYPSEKIPTSDQTAYTWDNRTSPNSQYCQDYAYLFLNKQWGKSWSTSVGTTLMGPPSSTDGLGNLNLDRNFVFDLAGFPFWTGYPAAVASGSFACADHKPPFTPSVTVTFSNLTASQSIPVGTSSVTLGGNIKGKNGSSTINSGKIQITIDEQTANATINSDGSFSTTFTTHDIPPSSVPYSIKYYYPGVGGTFPTATDTSTTLTVSANTSSTQLDNTNPNPAVYGQPLAFEAMVTSRFGLPGTTGTVNFYDGTTLIGSGVLNLAVAKVSNITLPVGTHSITATYGGIPGIDGLPPSTSAPSSQQVSQAITAFTGLRKNPSATTYGSNVPLGGSVIVPANPNLFPPTTDRVTITIGSVSQSTAIGTNGAFSLNFSTVGLPVGTYPVTYSFANDPNFGVANDHSTTLTIGKATPVFSNLTPSQTIIAGLTQAITFTGNISVGTLIPTGTVSVTYNHEQPEASPVYSPNGNFQVQLISDDLPASATPYVVTYAYSGDSNFNAISDTSTSVTVTAGMTNTMLALSPSTSIYGQPATFTATIKASLGTATGTVTFNDGDTPLGTRTLMNGVATFTTVSLPAGSHSITAVYGGTPSFVGSASTAQAQTVSQADPLFSGLKSSSVGQGTANTILSGTLSVPGPQGAVAATTQSSTNENVGMFFSLDPTGVTTDAATFSVWIKTTTKGQQMILQEPAANPCVYIQSDQIGLIWQGAGSNAGWLSNDITPISDGQWHHIAVSLNQGKITFYKDGVPTNDTFIATPSIASSNAVNFGGGAFNHIPSFVGEMWNAKVWAAASAQSDIQADMYLTYASPFPSALRLISGFTPFDPNGNTVTNLVNAAAARVTGVTLIPDGLPLFGQFPPGSELVQVTIDGKSQPATIGSYGAFSVSFSTAALAVGDHKVQYKYTGDANLAGTTDTNTILTITATSTTTKLVSSVNPSVFGQSVMFTATVSATSGTPTGTVAFKDGATTLGTGTLSGSQATFSTNSLAVGTNSITAVYAGTSGFTGSTSAVVPQTVNQATPSITNPTPSQSVNVGTATVQLTGTISAAGPVYPPAGETVTVTIGTAKGTATIGSNGQFTGSVPVSSLAVGAYPIQYSYAGDANFLSAANSNTTLTITAISTTTKLASSVNPSVFGQSVMFTATVSATSGTPTGMVAFKDGATTLGTGTLSGSQATFSTNSLAVGTNSITAVYAGASGFTGSTSAVVPQTVNQATPSITNLTPSQSVNVGTATVQLTGTISAAGPVYPPAGETVTVTIGTAKGTATIGSNGQFTGSVPVSSLAVGAYPIQYSYAGDANFLSAANSNTTLTITAISTTTKLASSVNPSVFGQSVMFTATVSATSGTPTGTVAFKDGATTLGTGTLSGSQATFSTNSLAVGTNSITAVYAGTSGFTGSTSAVVPQTVNQATPSITNPTPSQSVNVGTATVQLTGTISAAGPVYPPAGETVTVTIGTAKGTATIGSNGQFTGSVPVSSLAVGAYPIQYSYAGDANFLSAANSNTTLTITAISTTTKLASSVNPSVFGQSVMFTATVSATSGTPTGTVAFKDGATTLGTGTLSGSQATFSTNSLAVGTNSITAVYAGTSGFTGSTSAVVPQTVNQATPSITNPTPSQSVNVGTATVQLTGTISAAGPVYPPAGETVTVTIGTAKGTATIGSNGQFTGSVPVSSLAVGAYPIQYSYAGDANFLSAANSSTALTVIGTGPVASQLSMKATPNPAVVGQTVVLTATVQETIPGVMPTGNLTFSEPQLNGPALIYGSGDLVNGVVTVTVDASSPQQFAVGTHILAAVYSGDSNYLPTNISYNFVVNP